MTKDNVGYAEAGVKQADRRDVALQRSVSHLLDLQYEEGYWWGELESNATIIAEHLFLTYILGVGDKGQWRKIVNYLLKNQRDDGTWAIWYDGPGDLSTTIEAYLALKMAGISPDEPSMKKARSFVMSCGGVEKARIFTKIWLAMLGQWDWRGTPMMPPEIILLPKWFPINIYDFACWARGTVVPMTIIATLRPVFPLPRWAHIDELFANGKENVDLSLPRKKGRWAKFFSALDGFLRSYERLPIKPLRGKAVARAVDWIIERQEADGSWGGIQPPWVYSMIALKALGRDVDDTVMSKGLSGFYGKKGFAIESEDEFHLQACLSPVWDTALAAVALEDAGLARDHPALVKAGKWLIDEQILDGGDWQVRSEGRPGGWAFEFHNDVYPDTDDSALVMMAIDGVDVDEKKKKMSLNRGLEWLLSMQSSNGGWGAFDRNNTKAFLREIPFADFGEMIDPPSADVTAHIIEYLGRIGYQKDSSVISRALGYLRSQQEPDGAWFGRWGVNLVYGIGCVLPALVAIGEDMNLPYVRRAVKWLVDHQNDDGGWGERIEGYRDQDWRGEGPSTPSQTAWALLALIAAGEATNPSASAGIEYLICTQKEDGGWDESYFTGTGFPADFMINYHLYRDVFPVMALGRYSRALQNLRDAYKES